MLPRLSAFLPAHPCSLDVDSLLAKLPCWWLQAVTVAPSDTMSVAASFLLQSLCLRTQASPTQSHLLNGLLPPSSPSSAILGKTTRMIFLKPAYLILLLLETLLKLPWADGIKFKCDLRGPFPLALAYHLNLIPLLFCVEFFFQK